MKYWDIFIAFLKTGLTTFGGGPAVIPIVREEAVDNYQWLTEAEFIDALAFGNSLPGPIATKLAAFIGYRAGGWFGSGIALIATVLPTALLMILMFAIYQKYREELWMKGMLTLVKPVVFVLIFDVCVGMRSVLSNYTSIIVIIIAAIGLYFFKLHPAMLIMGSLIMGAFFIR